jgi:transaldolase
MTETVALSPLARTVAESPTDIWNDSCAVDELEYAIAFGAVGATANPTIVHDVWKKDPAHWRARARAIADENPAHTEVEIAWAIVEEMSTAGAKLLEPTFVRHGGRKGRLSMQTNPTFWRTPDRMLEQGVHFASLAPNVIVKFPATAVGIEVMEEATYRGVNVNCTVSFSVAQAVAAGEAVERGLRRREAEGLRTDDMGPVITIMMGRLEDWLRALAERDGIICDPESLPWRSGRSGSTPRRSRCATGSATRSRCDSWTTCWLVSRTSPEPMSRTGWRSRSSTRSGRLSGPCGRSSARTTTSSTR